MLLSIDMLRWCCGNSGGVAAGYGCVEGFDDPRSLSSFSRNISNIRLPTTPLTPFLVLVYILVDDHVGLPNDVEVYVEGEVIWQRDATEEDFQLRATVARPMPPWRFQQHCGDMPRCHCRRGRAEGRTEGGRVYGLCQVHRDLRNVGTGWAAWGWYKDKRAGTRRGVGGAKSKRNRRKTCMRWALTEALTPHKRKNKEQQRGRRSILAKSAHETTC